MGEEGSSIAVIRSTLKAAKGDSGLVIVAPSPARDRFHISVVLCERQQRGEWMLGAVFDF